MQTEKNKEITPSSFLISYIAIRRWVGILGMVLPIVLAMGTILLSHCGLYLQASISDYYYTQLRNYFVGTLCSVALFLFSYRGYNFKDNIAGNIASISALGIAFFPTKASEPSSPCNVLCLNSTPFISSLHYFFAIIFFSTLAYFSFFLFSKSAENPTVKKLKRNKIYRSCALSIVGCMLLIALHKLNILPAVNDRYHPVFWLETIALEAFGISWFVKGETILTDK